MDSYTRYRDFSQFQLDNPDTVFNGADFDTDYDRIKVVFDAIVSALADVRRDDGGVKNQSIGIDQLKTEVVNLLNGVTPRGNWATVTAYAKLDLVRQNNILYIALSAHTSGTFATDLAASKWMSISAATGAANVSNTPAGSIAATDVQSAINELDAEKQPLNANLTAIAALTLAANKMIYATGAGAVAVTDLTALARSLLGGANAAAMASTLEVLALAGGAMTGDLTLKGAPTTNLMAATKAYVDGVAATGGIGPGAIVAHSGIVLPSGWLWADGTAVSRTAYASLFAALVSSATATVTIATPGVWTWTAHGLQNNWPVRFTTTGALPTGLVAGTTYYVKSKATDTFQVSATPGGAAITTSGSQSGTHTAICAPHGIGDGSTTFNLPDARGRVLLGFDTSPVSSAAGRLTNAGTAALNGSIYGNSPGSGGGEESHALITAELASHTHGSVITSGSAGTVSVHNNDATPELVVNSVTFNGGSSGSAGSGTAHNNMPPSLIVGHIVKT